MGNLRVTGRGNDYDEIAVHGDIESSGQLEISEEEGEVLLLSNGVVLDVGWDDEASWVTLGVRYSPPGIQCVKHPGKRVPDDEDDPLGDTHQGEHDVVDVMGGPRVVWVSLCEAHDVVGLGDVD